MESVLAPPRFSWRWILGLFFDLIAVATIIAITIFSVTIATSHKLEPEVNVIWTQSQMKLPSGRYVTVQEV